MSEKMKRNAFLIVLVLLLLFCNKLVAQKFTVGAGGGLNFPSLIGDGSDNPTKAGGSFNLGGDLEAYAEYKITSNYACSVGLDYSSGGGLYKLKYLLVPFLVRQSWNIDEQTKYFAGVGPFAGILLNPDQVNNLGIIQNPNTFNMGLGGIVGISHRINDRGAFFIEFGTDFGYLRIQNPNRIASGRHMFIDTFKVGYSFALNYKPPRKHHPQLPYRKWHNN